MPRPFFGKYGAIGIGFQDAVGAPAAAPTLWLRTKQFMPPLPQRITTDDEIADGTIYASDSRDQGVRADTRQISFEPTIHTLPDLLAATFGGDPASGSLMLRNENFAALAPGRPVTIWQLHPVRNVVMQDAQLTGVQLQVSARQSVTGQLTVAAASIKRLDGVAPTPVLPAEGILLFKHFYAYYGAQLLRPKDGQLNFENPAEVQDGAQGLAPDLADYPVGWERSGAVNATSRLTVGPQDDATALLDAYEKGASAEYRAGFKVGNDSLEVTMYRTRVTSADPGNGLGVIDIPVDIKAIYNAGQPTFGFTKLPARV